MIERVTSPEQDPNQDVHDFLQEYAQAILGDIYASLRAKFGDNEIIDAVTCGYDLETVIRYEQKIDELLANRDIQQKGQ